MKERLVLHSYITVAADWFPVEFTRWMSQAQARVSSNQAEPSLKIRHFRAYSNKTAGELILKTKQYKSYLFHRVDNDAEC